MGPQGKTRDRPRPSIKSVIFGARDKSGCKIDLPRAKKESIFHQRICASKHHVSTLYCVFQTSEEMLSCENSLPKKNLTISARGSLEEIHQKIRNLILMKLQHFVFSGMDNLIQCN
jgi:hypothetical protein